MDTPTLDARVRLITTLWAALLSGVTVFAGVVLALTSGVVGSWTPSMAPSLAAGLMVIPVTSMVAGILYRRRELPRQGEAEERLAAYQTQVIVGAALQEGGGLFGCALALLSGQAAWALGVWLLTVVAMVLTRPSADEARALLR